MDPIWEESVFFGASVTLVTYGIGVLIKRRGKLAIFNPLLLAVLLTMAFIKVLDMDYDVYYDSAKYVSYLLTPATVCLAIPLYEKIQLLKNNWQAIMIGILSGVLTSMVSVLGLAVLWKLDYAQYATLLPKSITTAIGMGVSEELGGHVSITVAVIIITGILGSMIAEAVFRIFKITEPVAKGVALGTASHAIGTSKAMELGETEGAMSSLSIVVSGILTVIAAPVFAGFL